MFLDRRRRLGLWCTKQFREYCCCCYNFRRPAHLQDQPMDIFGYCQVYSAKLLLEVCGAAGAIWGSTEVVKLRNKHNNTNDLYRPLAIATFLFYLLRFIKHSKHYLEHEKDYPPIKLHHRRVHKVTFWHIFSTKFLLEVCGAAGAIWGSSEALTLRDDTNIETWRAVAIVVGILFWIRWLCLVSEYCLCAISMMVTRSTLLMTILKWIEVLVVKFVLEVLGAAGAVWGFSEIILLRTPTTVGVWRPVAIGVGLIFTGRWMWHIHTFVLEERQAPPLTEPVGPKNTTTDEIQDLELTDLALTESVDSTDSMEKKKDVEK